jgi:hypothetical protein
LDYGGLERERVELAPMATMVAGLVKNELVLGRRGKKGKWRGYCVF